VLDSTYYITVPAYCTLTVDELYSNSNSYIDLYDGQPQLGNLYNNLPEKAESSALCYRFSEFTSRTQIHSHLLTYFDKRRLYYVCLSR